MNTEQRIAWLAQELGVTDRMTKTHRRERENVAVHTVNLALLVSHLGPSQPGLDVSRAVELAVVHDLVEAIVGDTPTFWPLSDVDQIAKRVREAHGLQTLPSFIGESRIMSAIGEHECRTTLEAKFVYVVDKMTPKLTHGLNDYVVLVEEGVRVADLQDIRRRQMEYLHEVCSGVVLLEPDGFCDRVWDELIDGYAALLARKAG